MILHVRPKTRLGFAASIGILALAGCAAPDATDSVRTSAFGTTITIGFETDASGAPLARGTILAEQYAAWGIHFTGGYAVGAESVDFPDYQDAHGNMLCTDYAATDNFPASAWTGQRCFPGQPATGAPLGINLDFPACEVAIRIYPYVRSLLGGLGQYTITGSTVTGTLVATMANAAIQSIFPLGAEEMATPAYVPGGPLSGGPPPHEGANIQIVSLTTSAAGALDDLLIVPCTDGSGVGGMGGASGGGLGGGGGTGTGGNYSAGGVGGTAGISGGGGLAGHTASPATGGQPGSGGGSGTGGEAMAGHPGAGAVGGGSAGTAGGHSGSAGTGGMTSSAGSGGAVSNGGAPGTAGSGGATAGGGTPGTAGQPAAPGGAGAAAGSAGADAGSGGNPGTAGHPAAPGGAGGEGTQRPDGGLDGGTGDRAGSTSGCSYVSATPSADRSVPLWWALGMLAVSTRLRRRRSGT